MSHSSHQRAPRVLFAFRILLANALSFCSVISAPAGSLLAVSRRRRNVFIKSMISSEFRWENVERFDLCRRERDRSLSDQRPVWSRCSRLDAASQKKIKMAAQKRMSTY